MQLINLIKRRRSVRKFKHKKIPEEEIETVLEAARWAPSTNNLQNWRFIVIEDTEKKKKVASASLHQDWITDAPALIVVCSLTRKVRQQFRTRGEMYAIQNTASAIQNMILCANTRGLSTCWVGAFIDSKMRRICKVPDKVDIHAILALGYANERPYTPPRYELSEITYFGEWGAKPKDYSFGLEEGEPLLEKKSIQNIKEKVRKNLNKIKRKKQNK